MELQYKSPVCVCVYHTGPGHQNLKNQKWKYALLTDIDILQKHRLAQSYHISNLFRDILLILTF